MVFIDVFVLICVQCTVHRYVYLSKGKVPPMRRKVELYSSGAPSITLGFFYMKILRNAQALVPKNIHFISKRKINMLFNIPSWKYTPLSSIYFLIFIYRNRNHNKVNNSTREAIIIFFFQNISFLL